MARNRRRNWKSLTLRPIYQEFVPGKHPAMTGRSLVLPIFAEVLEALMGKERDEDTHRLYDLGDHLVVIMRDGYCGAHFIVDTLECQVLCPYWTEKGVRF